MTWIDLQGMHEFRPSNFKIIAPETTPELKHVEKLAREIHKYSFLRRAQGQYHSEWVSLFLTL